MDSDARTTVLNLMNQKQRIEEEINRNGDVLRENGLGMDEPLVDNEGFPLADVDVYAVRHARQRIICLQNDYKALMRQIENGLSEYYQSNVSSPNAEGPRHNLPPPASIINIRQAEIPPFAKVVNVINDSPADKAGLQNGDLLIQFGSVNGNNFKEIASIASIVQHSENQDIQVTIKRDRSTQNLKLKPQKWIGRGLLGCTILPLDNIDR